MLGPLASARRFARPHGFSPAGLLVGPSELGRFAAKPQALPASTGRLGALRMSAVLSSRAPSVSQVIERCQQGRLRPPRRLAPRFRPFPGIFALGLAASRPSSLIVCCVASFPWSSHRYYPLGRRFGPGWAGYPLHSRFLHRRFHDATDRRRIGAPCRFALPRSMALSAPAVNRS